MFLLDEPLSNLDAKLRLTMRVEIARLHRQLGTTMVYVTHDQIEAMTLGQRIVVLRDGQIQQIDTPMALYERPANLFVATFLGSPAMNVLTGRLVRADGLSLDLGGGQRVPLGAAAVADPWLGREITVGIRPEDLHPAATGGERTFAPDVEVVEPVGNEVFVNLRLGPQVLVAACRRMRCPPWGRRCRSRRPGRSCISSTRRLAGGWTSPPEPRSARRPAGLAILGRGKPVFQMLVSFQIK